MIYTCLYHMFHLRADAASVHPFAAVLTSNAFHQHNHSVLGGSGMFPANYVDVVEEP